MSLKDLDKAIDYGFIGMNSKQLRNYKKAESEFGEFVDVYAVAKGRKPLAALDASLDLEGVEKILDFAKSKGVQVVTVYPSRDKWGRGGYLKSIFFKPRNKRKALTLLGILWGCVKKRYFGCSSLKKWEFHTAIGYLLGYRRKNIREFVKTRFGKHVTPKQFAALVRKVKNLTFWENESGFYNPVLKSTNRYEISKTY